MPTQAHNRPHQQLHQNPLVRCPILGRSFYLHSNPSLTCYICSIIGFVHSEHFIEQSAALLEESWTSLSTSFLDVISSTPSKLATALSTSSTSSLPPDSASKGAAAPSTSNSSEALSTAQAPVAPSETPPKALNTFLNTHQTPSTPFKPSSEPKVSQILSQPPPATPTAIDASRDPLSNSQVDFEPNTGASVPTTPGVELPSDQQNSSILPDSALQVPSTSEKELNTTQNAPEETESSNNMEFDSFDEPSTSQQFLPATATEDQNSNAQEFGNWDSDPWNDDFKPSSEPSPLDAWEIDEVVAESNSAPAAHPESSDDSKSVNVDEGETVDPTEPVNELSSSSNDDTEPQTLLPDTSAQPPPTGVDASSISDTFDSEPICATEAPLEPQNTDPTTSFLDESPNISAAPSSDAVAEEAFVDSSAPTEEVVHPRLLEAAQNVSSDDVFPEASPSEPTPVIDQDDHSNEPSEGMLPISYPTPAEITTPNSEAVQLASKIETPVVLPSTPSTSDSSQIRHLQSKLDVLSRILEERERQLSSRSSTMAEVQNENAQLKSELETFRNAQAKIKDPSSSGTQLTLIDAIAEEFGERIGVMEKKYRTCLKDREKLSEQLKMSEQRLDATNTQLSAMNSELESYRTGKPVAASVAPTAPPSTPSRLLGQVLNTSMLSTPSGSNNSLIDSAFSSISSMLNSPSQPDLKQLSTPQSSVQASKLPTSTSSSDTTTDKEHSAEGAISTTTAPTLEEELRAEGLVLHEKLQHSEGIIRQLKAREKSHLAEIKQLESKVASLSLELQSHATDKQSAESESTRARESEKKLKSAMEAQKDALEIKAKQLSERMSSAETLERESSSLKAELESSWRLNESLRKELEQNKADNEQARQQLEARYQSLNLEASAAIVSKSAQQQQMLQNTIEELRAALDGNKTLKSNQEEALEARVLDLETALLSTEQHLTMSRQTAELAQSPLLKQISDLQTQLAHQQRALEVVEEAWKSRAQDLESSLTGSSQDLTNAQSQIRSAEMATHKIQAQYARLEHQHQTLQIEFDQLTLESAALESDKETLEIALDNIKASNSSLNAKLSGSNAKTEELIAEQKETISKLEAQVSALNHRISSLTTPGYSSSNFSASHSSLQSSASASPSTSRGHSPTPSLVGISSLNAPPPVSTPQKSAHTATAMETQLSLLRAEKSRAEEMLAEALHTSSKAESLEASLRAAEEEKARLQERLDAALELVTEQSERLEFSDEEVAETKQLYKQEIANLVAQLAEMQSQISQLQSSSSPSK